MTISLIEGLTTTHAAIVQGCTFFILELFHLFLIEKYSS